MELLFLGTGPAWGLPETHCDCLICKEMRQRGERRTRSGLFLMGEDPILLDCSPDIKAQMEENHIGNDIRAVLISHEHNDHYMGLDDLFPLKRIRPRGAFEPVGLYLTETTYGEIQKRFGYLEKFEVLRPYVVKEGRWYDLRGASFMPFKTYHGESAKGSVGYVIKAKTVHSGTKTIVYTSDFMDIPLVLEGIKRPDYLIIQSFWLNEPKENRPKHMSFQRAIDYIRIIEPQKAAFLVHMGDGERVLGDPRNDMLKKYEPKDPLRPPKGGTPYPVPRSQREWQEVVDQIVYDYRLEFSIYVARDGLKVSLD